MVTFRIFTDQILFEWSNQEDGTIGACSTYEGEERIIMDFGGKAREKRPHGRPMCRWKNLVKCTFKN
jgi:hypothetical protein